MLTRADAFPSRKVRSESSISGRICHQPDASFGRCAMARFSSLDCSWQLSEFHANSAGMGYAADRPVLSGLALFISQQRAQEFKG